MTDEFRLTPKHVRAIEAQADLIVDSGFGEITLIFEKGRITRITLLTSEVYMDDSRKKTTEKAPDT